MRALIQRVRCASVRVSEELVGHIDSGLVVLVGAGRDDLPADARRLAAKVARLRIFSSDDGRFQRSLLDVGGSALVVSQFTLYADCTKGRRPSFERAARAEEARERVDEFIDELRRFSVPVQAGQFGAHMVVDLSNDGPVTIWLDSAEC